MASKDQRGTVEQLGPGDAGVLLRGSPESKEHLWEVRRPVGTGRAGTEGVLQLAVSYLHHAICLRMVGGGARWCPGAEKAEPMHWYRTDLLSFRRRMRDLSGPIVMATPVAGVSRQPCGDARPVTRDTEARVSQEESPCGVVLEEDQVAQAAGIETAHVA